MSDDQDRLIQSGSFSTNVGTFTFVIHHALTHNIILATLCVTFGILIGELNLIMSFKLTKNKKDFADFQRFFKLLWCNLSNKCSH